MVGVGGTLGSLAGITLYKVTCNDIIVQYFQKCNLMLAMSPTCHSNNTIKSFKFHVDLPIFF